MCNLLRNIVSAKRLKDRAAARARNEAEAKAAGVSAAGDAEQTSIMGGDASQSGNDESVTVVNAREGNQESTKMPSPTAIGKGKLHGSDQPESCATPPAEEDEEEAGAFAGDETDMDTSTVGSSTFVLGDLALPRGMADVLARQAAEEEAARLMQEDLSMLLG